MESPKPLTFNDVLSAIDTLDKLTYGQSKEARAAVFAMVGCKPPEISTPHSAPPMSESHGGEFKP